MARPKYQDVLQQLLSLWELQLAKLEGRRPRTLPRSVSRSLFSTNERNAQPTACRPAEGQYLSQRIDRAVEPLATLLHESDLRFIKIMLQERLRTDPHLSRIVERAARRLRRGGRRKKHATERSG